MIGKISPFAIDAIGFVGIIRYKISIGDFIVVSPVGASSRPKFAPTPG